MRGPLRRRVEKDIFDSFWNEAKGEFSVEHPCHSWTVERHYRDVLGAREEVLRYPGIPCKVRYYPPHDKYRGYVLKTAEVKPWIDGYEGSW